MRALRAELARLWTLPAIRWTAALTVATTILLARVTPEPLRYTQAGFLVLGVLAAVQDRVAALLAMPRRARSAAAKATALTVVAAPLAALVAHEPAPAARLTLAAVLGWATGTLVRHPVGATALLLAVVLTAAPVLGWDWLPVVVDDPGVALLAWTAAVTAGAVATFAHRDA